MIIIIPLGGTGERFKKNNYKKPKALINVFGKPILFYLLDNLTLNNIDYIYIPYNKEYVNYNFESLLIKNYPNINFKFFILENNTRGAAETLNISIKNLNEDYNKPVLCLDSDNFYLSDIVSMWNGSNSVFTIIDKNPQPIYSYIKIDNFNNLICIKEKEKISDYACTGAYGFESIHGLEKYTSKIIENNITQKSEFYTSGVINEMLNDQIIFKNINIPNSKFICLGTPIQLKLFYNNYPKISCVNDKILIKKKRICFDLDNTLVTYPYIQNDYTSVKPIQKNIDLLKYLKRFNNTIIIYTARRMKTHNGNIGKINADIGKITFDTLEKFNIPYDEIYFGKPYADFYIDDLAINCFDDIEKEIGFYNNFIASRDFNNIQNSSIDIIKKNGMDLSGEIYYYNNIPTEIKDLFPIFFNYSENYYEVEKIKGINLNDLYLSELLTKDILKNILNSIKRLQNTHFNNIDNIDIYSNYSKKIISRFENYDYSIFENSKNIYLHLKNYLEDYENNKKGIKKIIHGDPVFTNIIINKYDKIKLIDMRGKIGNQLSICGDWLYDWAKIYQSLIGYDEILMNKNISLSYKKNLINYFKNYFINEYSEQDFNNLKLITKSLIFTLIPLHNNYKCQLYYNLIFTDDLK
tara:strand:+ start:444 stop:2354 length:1911 start_codon:yes stop_codon:yes gene_type:complete